MKEKQNENIIFLNLIYQNAEMGLIGIDSVIGKIENEKVSKLVKEQREEYENICEEAKKILLKFGAQEEEIGAIKKMASKMMSEMMTLNKSDKDIVKLMMEGNQKGIIEIQEKLNCFENQDEEVVNLAKKLLATEEHNREEFKEFL